MRNFPRQKTKESGMMKEAPHADISVKTFITADNWDDLQQRGFVHCTNVLDYSAYSMAFSGEEADRVAKLLRWEVGEKNVLEGWVFIDGKPEPPEPPHPFYGPRDDLGFYVMPPDDEWTHPWSRMLHADHPDVEAAGIGRLVEPDLDDFASWVTMKPQWDIWSVFGSQDRFRCWGPDTDWDSKFEGTLPEVIAHIKAWEAEHGEDCN